MIFSNKIQPWFNSNNQVDLPLLTSSPSLPFETDNCTNNINKVILELPANFSHILGVDGSVKRDGKVGAAISSLPILSNCQFKLVNDIPVYCAEALAILHAINYINER